MADDWENASDNDTHVPIALPTKKWDDEDVDESKVKASWEDSDEEEEGEAKPSAPPPRKKVPFMQRAAEREAKRKEAVEAAKLREEEDEDDSDEDPVERKQRLHQLELNADLENAASMFRGVNIEDIQLEQMDPKTKEEFDEFAKLLLMRIRRHEKSSLYVNFINSFIRELCLPLKDVDVRKVSSTLTTLVNEKIKASKEAKPKKKGKAKPSLVSSKDPTMDDVAAAEFNRAYDDGDFDDFM